MVHNAIRNWIASPTEVAIATFSLPATRLAYPAVTVCRRGRHDVGEYIRAVFDNFEFACDEDVAGSCNASDRIRKEYWKYASFLPTTIQVIYLLFGEACIIRVQDLPWLQSYYWYSYADSMTNLYLENWLSVINLNGYDIEGQHPFNRGNIFKRP